MKAKPTYQYFMKWDKPNPDVFIVEHVSGRTAEEVWKYIREQVVLARLGECRHDWMKRVWEEGLRVVKCKITEL